MQRLSKSNEIENFFSLHKNTIKTNTNNSCSIIRRDAFSCNQAIDYERWNFFKISLVVEGKGELKFGDKTIEVDRSALVITNPYLPYSWLPTTSEQTGYFCLFSGDFLGDGSRDHSILNSPFFLLSDDTVRFPDKEQLTILSGFFEGMLREQSDPRTETAHALRNYVELILHEFIKLKPSSYQAQDTSAYRITTKFLELLHEKSTGDFKVFKPADVADALSVHVSHLNRSVKEVTGKTTSAIIAEQAIREAHYLLLNSGLTVSEVAYSLGFSHPSSFNTFFRKHTNLSPNLFRERTAHLN